MHKLYPNDHIYAFSFLCPETQDKVLLISLPILIQIDPKFIEFLFGLRPVSVPLVFFESDKKHAHR